VTCTSSAAARASFDRSVNAFRAKQPAPGLQVRYAASTTFVPLIAARTGSRSATPRGVKKATTPSPRPRFAAERSTKAARPARFRLVGSAVDPCNRTIDPPRRCACSSAPSSDRPRSTHQACRCLAPRRAPPHRPLPQGGLPPSFYHVKFTPIVALRSKPSSPPPTASEAPSVPNAVP